MKLILTKNDNILIEVLWLISILTSDKFEYISKFIELNLISISLNIFSKKKDNLYIPLIRIIGIFLNNKGNLCRGPDEIINNLLKDENFLHILNELMLSNSEIFQKETCWLLSNLGKKFILKIYIKNYLILFI
jgi:hypothetical protein